MVATSSSHLGADYTKIPPRKLRRAIECQVMPRRTRDKPSGIYLYIDMGGLSVDTHSMSILLSSEVPLSSGI